MIARTSSATATRSRNLRKGMPSSSTGKWRSTGKFIPCYCHCFAFVSFTSTVSDIKDGDTDRSLKLWNASVSSWRSTNQAISRPTGRKLECSKLWECSKEKNATTSWTGKKFVERERSTATRCWRTRKTCGWFKMNQSNAFQGNDWKLV